MKTNSALSAFFAMAIPVAAWAQAGLPTGASVVAGSAAISATASSMTVTTGSQRTIINYSGFNVGAGNSVSFNQPSSSSATLNRVISIEGSSILGSVSSNGQIFLVNPNGIFVGAGGSFSGSSVHLSTGNISNSDFLAGNIHFDPPPTGSTIRIDGRVDATDDIRFYSDRLYLVGSLHSQSGSIIFDSTPGLLNVETITLSGPGSGGSPVLTGGTLTMNGGTGSSGSLVLTGGKINLTSVSTGGTGSGGSLVSTGGTITLSGTGSGGNPVLTAGTSNPPATGIVNPVTPSGSAVATTSRSPDLTVTNSPGAIVSIANPVWAMSTDGQQHSSVSIQTPNLVLAPALPGAMLLPPSIPRGTSGLMDGSVTVRLSLVDAAPISLR